MIKKMSSLVNLIVMAVGFGGCVTSTYTVKTDPPGAEVYVKSFDSDEKQLIGQTPLTLSYSELREKTKIPASSGEFFRLILEKKDYQAETMLVPASRMGHSSTMIVIKMKSGGEAVSKVNLLLQHLFNAQKLANEGDFERAQIEIDKDLEIEPNFTRAMSLRGSIFFLQKKFDESMKWFEKALAVDPGFSDAIKMIAQIKKINGMTDSSKSSGKNVPAGEGETAK